MGLHRMWFYLALCGATLSISACEKAEHPLADTQPTEAASALQDLKLKVLRLEFRVSQLQQRYSVAWFDTTGDKSYQRVDTNLGPLLVILDDVQPYLDGSKVSLLIGNPSTAIFSGIKLNVEWGPKYPEIPEGGEIPQDIAAKWSEVDAQSKKKEVSLTDSLRAGTWTRVTFTVSPAKPETFGRLGIAAAVNEVVLRATP